MDRIAQRKASMAAGLSAADARHQREETAIRLRKQRRDEQLTKKREKFIPSHADHFNIDISQELPMLLQALFSQDPVQELQATTSFRKILSIEINPPIKQVVDAGVVPKFVQFLTRFDFSDLQFEAAWALTNIASGTSDDTHTVIRANAVPLFVQLLRSPNIDVREQAVWALGNIAGDSPTCRDLVLAHDAMAPVLAQLIDVTKVSMMRNATWTLSNFCRGKPQPEFKLVCTALPTLARFISITDEEVLTDVCWALSYLSDGSIERIQAVLDAGVAQRLSELLLHSSPTVQTPALRTVGNIVTGDDPQTQAMIDVSILPGLLLLLSHPKRSIRKEACWTISNITAGTSRQIENVIQAHLIPPLIGLLTNAEYETRKEAAWAITNATSGGSPDHIAYLVNQGCIRPLCDLLTVQEPRVLSVALEAIENILRSGEDMRYAHNLESNPYLDLVEAADGLEKIEVLQNHANREIFARAHDIIDTYCELIDLDGENDQPAVDEQGRFQFNPGQQPGVGGGFNFS